MALAFLSGESLLEFGISWDGTAARGSTEPPRGTPLSFSLEHTRRRGGSHYLLSVPVHVRTQQVVELKLRFHSSVSFHLSVNSVYIHSCANSLYICVISTVRKSVKSFICALNKTRGLDSIRKTLVRSHSYSFGLTHSHGQLKGVISNAIHDEFPSRCALIRRTSNVYS